MRILICSDGTDPADNPTRLGGLIAGPCHSQTTLLGIAEDSADEEALRRALASEADMLRQQGVSPEIVVRSGDPIRQILPSMKHWLQIRQRLRRKKSLDAIHYDETFRLDKKPPASPVSRMKFLGLVWSNLKRKKLRTVLTVLSILVAFLLFGALCAIKAAFTAGVTLAGRDRLIVRHKVSIIQSLPQSYEQRIANVPGVDAVSGQSWMGGIYQDPKNFLATIPFCRREGESILLYNHCRY